MGKIVRFYQAEDGRTPVKDFLDSLPGKVARKVPTRYGMTRTVPLPRSRLSPCIH